jgi:hypothetical protein
MTYCSTTLGFFEGGRRTCISAISGRDAFGSCETIKILNKYVWCTDETSPTEPCD